MRFLSMMAAGGAVGSWAIYLTHGTDFSWKFTVTLLIASWYLSTISRARRNHASDT